MPSFGADMVAGTLVAWLKKPGDHVERGDVIAEVDTDKGVIEVEVFATGVLEKILVAEGTKVPVGTPLALIREGDEVLLPPPLPATETPPQAGSLHAPPGELHAPKVKISPSARRLARERGVDPERVRGTGRDGAITRADIERARTTDENARTAGDPAERMRQAIANAMARSNREIPHYYLTHSIDMTPALRFLTHWNDEHPITERLLPAVLFVRAVALALQEFPELNGRFEDGRFRPSSAINVGFAISLRGGGLVIPCLHDANRASLPELMARLVELTSRARQGRLKSSELSEGTITLTSLGDRGVDGVLGVIFPPQVALVGFGAIQTRPWVVDGAVVPRSVVEASLAADHRVSDGHRGALFLSALAERLKELESS
jgi:pyruvate dehydrogenase E2 component (dihydrolipoamide acetyltransferase)